MHDSSTSSAARSAPRHSPSSEPTIEVSEFTDSTGVDWETSQPEEPEAEEADERSGARRLPETRAIVMQGKPHSLEPEAGEALGMAAGDQLDTFRELRTRLFAMAATRGLYHFTTLVVPLSPGAGASFVARNLSAVFTLHDDRFALLIDCNPKHPSQHEALGSRPGASGLFEYLERPHPSLDKLVLPTVIPRLHLIPGGKPSAHVREYFSSMAMRMLLTGLRQEPCTIVLDGPAMKGAPDARILSDLADLVVLVVGYGLDRADDIAQAASVFDPEKFAGVVFNERG